MPRSSTTADAFNAVAERRRRDIIDLLARSPGAPLPVNELVIKLRLPQPAVSKHLGVLRKVGLVRMEKQGQQRLYSLNPDQLKPVYDWVKTFEQFWTEHLDAIKEAAERKARAQSAERN